MNSKQLLRIVPAYRTLSVRMMSGGEAGSGAGMGGGSGGSIRDAGGAMGKRQAALEEKYFHDMQLKQLAALKDNLEEEIDYHKEQIKVHSEALEKRVKRLQKMEKE